MRKPRHLCTVRGSRDAGHGQILGLDLTESELLTLLCAFLLLALHHHEPCSASRLLHRAIRHNSAASAHAHSSGSSTGIIDVGEGRCKIPLLFVFGASMVDTGEYTAALPYSAAADFPPYGLDYFPRPAGRWSNGRVITDFITQTLGYGFLNPYLKAFNSNFTCGANFAVAGSKAVDDGLASFPLPAQVNQFRYFLSQALIINQSTSSDSSAGYTQEQIAQAIYFVETASNDYTTLLDAAGLDFDVSAAIGDVMSSMNESLQALYGLGARNMLVMSTTPVGCAPSSLVSFSSLAEDEFGCKKAINSIFDRHNQHLQALLSNLSTEFPDANWIFFDAYSLFLDGYQNPSKYGIEYPFKACCGAGGEYNYNPGIQCGSSGYVNGTLVKAERCSDPTLYLIWDGLHPTESFARYVAAGVTSGEFLRPDIKCKSFRVANSSPRKQDLTISSLASIHR